VTDNDDRTPTRCPLCGAELERVEEAGQEPGVMTVYEIACPECREMGVTVPETDVQTAAERFQRRQEDRRRERGQGGRPR
jgi:endogenous inhibitor of DNA gyrase (YacG/DUF329 family)